MSGMRVYIAMASVPWDNAWPIGVFSEMDLALEALARYKETSDDDLSCSYVQDWVLDSELQRG